MSEDLVLTMILKRLDRLEAKVDKLLFFRAWVLGVAAGLGAVMGALASVATKWL